MPITMLFLIYKKMKWIFEKCKNALENFFTAHQTEKIQSALLFRYFST